MTSCIMIVENYIPINGEMIMTKEKHMNNKKMTWYMLCSILYVMVVYILSIAFALHSNDYYI